MCFNSLAQVLQEGGCRGVELSADHPIPLRREVDALSSPLSGISEGITAYGASVSSLKQKKQSIALLPSWSQTR